MFEIVQKNNHPNNGAKIKVVGVGGGGGNIVSTMIEQGVKFVDFMVANTDMQALQSHPSKIKIQLGGELTKGLGAGANPEIGREAAMESYSDLRSQLEGADMVFITAGMGGGTGTGAAPIVAKAAKEADALTIGVVTLPFQFEGKRRKEQAHQGIYDLKQQVDTLIVVPNEKLIALASENLSLVDSFKKVDEILLRAVRSVADLINVHGLINLDFSDICTIMRNRGTAIMGIGEGYGAHRSMEAARAAMVSPLLENIDIDGARGIILSMMGPSDLSLKEVNDAATLITERTHEDAEIVFGAVIDPNMKEGQVRITLIATGFLSEKESKSKFSTSSKIASTPSTSSTSTGSIGINNIATSSSVPTQPSPKNNSNRLNLSYSYPKQKEQNTFQKRQAPLTPLKKNPNLNPQENTSLKTANEHKVAAEESKIGALFTSPFKSRSLSSGFFKHRSESQRPVDGTSKDDLEVPAFMRQPLSDNQDESN